MVLNILVWIIFGSLIALFASKYSSSSEQETTSLMVLGMVGAVVGGLIGLLVVDYANSSISIVALAAALFSSIALIHFYKNINPLT